MLDEKGNFVSPGSISRPTAAVDSKNVDAGADADVDIGADSVAVTPALKRQRPTRTTRKGAVNTYTGSGATGVIAADQEASADNIIGSLRDAFDADEALGVILRINSPGGSPVQSGYIFDEIRRLKETRPDFPVYAVIMDLGASGAYYIAAAADEIYADKASLVGSIGVIGSGFGFVDTMEKLGVERRLYTSGEHKAFLDPFSPQNEEEKEFWQGVLKVTHKQFISQVKLGRGERLNETPDMFSGLVWTGEQAVDMGLVDGLSSSSQIARDVLGTDELVSYTYRPDPFAKFVEKFGMSFGQGVATFFQQQTMVLR